MIKQDVAKSPRRNNARLKPTLNSKRPKSAAQVRAQLGASRRTDEKISELVKKIAAEQVALDSLKKSRARARADFTTKQNFWTEAATSLGASAAAGMVVVMAVPSASFLLPVGVAAAAGIAVAALVERGRNHPGKLGSAQGAEGSGSAR